MCGVKLVRITILPCYSSNIIRDYFSGDDEDYSDVSSQAPTNPGGCLLPLRGGGDKLFGTFSLYEDNFKLFFDLYFFIN